MLKIILGVKIILARPIIVIVVLTTKQWNARYTDRRTALTLQANPG